MKEAQLQVPGAPVAMFSNSVLQEGSRRSGRRNDLLINSRDLRKDITPNFVMNRATSMEE